jgi:hypothetical protein
MWDDNIENEVRTMAEYSGGGERKSLRVFFLLRIYCLKLSFRNKQNENARKNVEKKILFQMWNLFIVLKFVWLSKGHTHTQKIVLKSYF